MKFMPVGRFTITGAASLLLLTGCMDIPRPFKGADATSQRLSAPPPARLVISTPQGSLLADQSAQLWQKDMVKALLDQTIPAIARPATENEWQLVLAAHPDKQQIIPTYTIISPEGKMRAQRSGPAVPASVWASGDQNVLKSTADAGSQLVAEMLTGIEAANMEKDPSSLKNRPAKVYFTGVKGAPGDGNIALARQFVVSFSDTKNTIQTTPKDADFTVSCVVSVRPGAAGTTGHPLDHVEIFWTITNKDGKEAGKVSQLNDIPAHTLDRYWGEVATVVAQEAAAGVKQVITNNSGRNNKPLPPPVTSSSPSQNGNEEDQADN